MRRRVWGGRGREGERKIHLGSWDVLRRPRERGGLGLKKAQAMNKALLAKLALRTVHGEMRVGANY